MSVSICWMKKHCNILVITNGLTFNVFSIQKLQKVCVCVEYVTANMLYTRAKQMFFACIPFIIYTNAKCVLTHTGNSCCVINTHDETMLKSNYAQHQTNRNSSDIRLYLFQMFADMMFLEQVFKLSHNKEIQLRNTNRFL